MYDSTTNYKPNAYHHTYRLRRRIDRSWSFRSGPLFRLLALRPSLTLTVTLTVTLTLPATITTTLTATLTALSSIVIYALFFLELIPDSFLHYILLSTQIAARVRYGRSSPKHLNQYVRSTIHKPPGSLLVTIDTPSFYREHRGSTLPLRRMHRFLITLLIGSRWLYR